MRHVQRMLLLAAVAGSLAACSTFDVEGDGSKTPDVAHGTATHHGSFWGFEWSGWTADKSDDGSGLLRVRYHTNALYAIATVCTLGLYVPQDVEWWCTAAPPAPERDDRGSSDPADLFGEGP